ncbi:anhydro-N-acetylmuramic acid kinase [Fimbriiglobus ruber]|uniref:Anhydro-N-acetylmuramic acid kinase n=1 Tax=Fimbriiglobus ruber TaxID=1908690 RepID=A0A225E8I1_9BACT|nr:anhydro-N-acetylmuramic acid kinase [Fimbriiglobus ruber]OWK47078.1 Anhydro-N-acetylmuramic acid kinase [Fimbriiglobus ruber]
MPPTRLLIGLSVGSGFEAADAVAVRAEGAGLGLVPRPAPAVRVPFPVEIRDAGRRLTRYAEPWSATFARSVGDVLAMAARLAAGRAGQDLRAALIAGLLSRVPDACVGTGPDRPFASPADWVAEQTGLTVVTGFRGRDVAAGGSGHPITAAADALLFRDSIEERLLVHLGSVTSVLLIPTGGKLSELVGFECGPGHRFLDDLTDLGTRGRDAFDPGGTKAVQGRCLEDVLAAWLAHPFLSRRPPKACPGGAFGGSFLTSAFDAARAAGGTLNDLLCTATHYIARCVAVGCERWLPAPKARRVMFASGGGTRNGFLCMLLENQFAGQTLERLDTIGVPAGARTATGAAILAGLALDGVSANLPLLTGASGSRLVGRFVPGDQRNWAACATWMADHLTDYPGFGRAA